jgi:hypothetical protein
MYGIHKLISFNLVQGNHVLDSNSPFRSRVSGGAISDRPQYADLNPALFHQPPNNTT